MCKSTIQTIHQDKGWYFNTCPKCGKSAYRKGSSSWCYICKGSVDSPDSRYKIEFNIEDNTGTIPITAFGKDVEFLLNTTFDSMIDLSQKEMEKYYSLRN